MAEVDFKPKSSADYPASIQAHILVKTRKHEAAVASLGKWAQSLGFSASTSEHPRELVVRRDGREFLVEVKVLYRGNAMQAVRAAIGQLITYRHFLYPSDTEVVPVAAFTEDVGQAFVDLLESLGIAVVWSVTASDWAGTSLAADAGLSK